MAKQSKDKRKVRFTVLLTESEKGILDTLAESMGKDNTSQVIRQLVKDKAREIDEAPVKGGKNG